MEKMIKLGMWKPVSTYGKFLFVKDSSRNGCLLDTENNYCEIPLPYLGENPILDATPDGDAVIFKDYRSGNECIFLKSVEKFLLNLESCSENDAIFDFVITYKNMICCKKRTSGWEGNHIFELKTEYWFDFAGNWYATIQHKDKSFHTIKLKNGEKINVCEITEVHEMEDAGTIRGLRIILMKDETECNFFYPFF